MKKQLTFLITLIIMLALLVTVFWGCKKEELATLTTLAPSEIIANSAKSGGNISNDGGGEISSRGTVWAIHESPSIEQHVGITTDGSGVGLFTSNITNLSPGATYYARAFAVNGAGTAYGNQVSFTTTASLPTVTTSNATEITSNSAKVGGSVTDDGGGSITAWGIVYSMSQNPTTSDNTVIAGGGIGSFTTDLSGLSQGTTYYARAFATNSAGTAYGNRVTFSTINPPVASFVANPISGTAPLTVSFTDQSTNNPTSWSWNFGDGTTSSQQNPSKTYNNPGDYTVQLTVSNTHGSNAETKTAYIQVSGGQGGETGTFTDTRDDQTYKWVKIGDQVWMAENLKYLPSVVGPDTDSYTTPYYYIYGYNGTDVNAAKSTANYSTYGVLYNWAALMNGASSSSANPSGVQGVCPPGWHVPSDAEWTQLVNYVVAQGYPNSWNNVNGAGNALKSCRQVGARLGGVCNTSDHPRWDSHGGHYGTDKFGFSALPGGRYGTDGNFDRIGNHGYWLSATAASNADAWGRHLHVGAAAVYRHYLGYDKADGFSLRCVRD